MKYLSWFLVIVATQFAVADERFSAPLDQQTLIEEARQLLDEIETPYEKTTNILSRIQINIDGDKVVSRVNEIWFYPTTVAVEEFGTDAIYFGNSTQSVELNMAASLRPNGEVSILDAKTVQFAESDSYNTFTDGKRAYLPIPALSKGSFSIVDYTITDDISLSQGGYSQPIWVDGNYHVRTKEIEIEWANLDISAENTHPDLRCESTDNSMVCRAVNVEPLEIETNEYWRDKIRGLHVVADANWPTLIKNMDSLYQQAFTSTDNLESLFQELTQGLQTNEERINAIFRFVSEDVRYVSLSTQGHSHQPHTVDSVIENRYGDCKDKTALLHALLSRLGLSPVPRLVATYRTTTEALSLPSIGYFNHIILCFEWQGQEYCLDPTDYQTHWNYTSEWIQGKVSLALEPDAEPELIKVAKYRWRMDVVTDITITEDGGSDEKQTRIYHGEYAAHLRSQLQDSDEEERLERLVSHYRDIVADIDNVSTEITTPFDGDKKELKVVTESMFPTFLDTSSDIQYSEGEPWLVDELDSVKIDEELTQAEMEGLLITSKFQIDISKSWNAAKPSPSFSFQSQFGGITRSSRTDDGFVYVETELKLPYQKLTKETIPEFNAFIDRLSGLLEIRIDALVKP
jgi:hypothetical protein